MPKEVLFKMNPDGSLSCISKARAEGDRDQKKFRNPGLGLTHDSEGAGTNHHMVPWGQLGRVLGAALSEIRLKRTDTLLRKLLPVCYQPSRLDVDRYCATIQGAVAAMVGEDEKKGKAANVVVAYSDGFTSKDDLVLTALSQGDLIYDLVNHWCWMPGNLFLGSSSRTDDPGDWGFDIPSSRAKRHGVEAEEKGDAGALLIASRVSNLFNFYTFLRDVAIDANLWGAKRLELIDHLEWLAGDDLWQWQRYLNSNVGGCWGPGTKPNHFVVTNYLLPAEGMDVELKFHAAVIAAGGIDAYEKGQKKVAPPPAKKRVGAAAAAPAVALPPPVMVPVAPKCAACGCTTWVPASRDASENWDCALCEHAHQTS
jgi:hypothetical protein